MRPVILKHDGHCSTCEGAILGRTKAWWDGANKRVLCVDCLPTPEEAAALARPSLVDASGSPSQPNQPPSATSQSAASPSPSDWAPALVAAATVVEPEWNARVAADRLLPATMRRELGDNVIVLDDRVCPATGETIEHLVVAPTGVWVIDLTSGQPHNPKSSFGFARRSARDSYLDGRNRVKLVGPIQRQRDLVATAVERSNVGLVPVRGAVCFDDNDSPRFGGTGETHGVLVGYMRSVVHRVRRGALLTDDEVLELAHRLVHELPPAT